MDEEHLLELARQLMAVAGMLMEDESTGLLVSNSDIAQVKASCERLGRVAADLTAIFKCIEVLITRKC